MGKGYFIGLDMGTSSVGWAVTDDNYQLMRAKGHDLIGFRLFDEANTAAEKRSFRSNRRRLHRANNRLKLLRMLFRDEIAKIDPDFYLRLKESFYLAEDKNGLNHDKNTLFADANYTDKDFHKEFPTIWHLRQTLIEGQKKYDIRLYFLAIQHIIKHRGHFLFGGEIENIDNSFSELYQELIDNCENYITLDPSKAETFQQILSSKKSKNDKKKLISSTIIMDGDDENIDLKIFPALFTGSLVSFSKLFRIDLEDEKKFSFDNEKIDEKIDDLSNYLTSEQFELVVAAKKIYDFILLKNLLSDSNNISAAMVKNYYKHQQELAELKNILKAHPKYYDEVFNSTNDKSYNTYIGKTQKNINQEDFNKYLHEILVKINYQGPLLSETENRTLLPKQKGQAKGSIPMQLHRNELKQILRNLGRDYPAFVTENPNESPEYNTRNKKILQIHSFRIPYYCGPLVKRKYDNNGDPLSGGKSEFSWADEEIKQIVYPWNFSELINLEQRATNFIRRMTNECTYLVGEDVMPKASLSYQKYMVLNELNNLKVNGTRISDVQLKQDIFEKFFYGEDAINNNFKIKTFKKYLVDYAFIDKDDDLSGISDDKYLPKLSTHLALVKILGSDYVKKYSLSDLEAVIETITIIGDEADMCEKKITQILHCDANIATKLRKIKCDDWGKFSNKLLNQLKINLEGSQMTLLDALYETNYNFMELMSLGLSDQIEEFNHLDFTQSNALTYEQVKNLYCSPAVKRSIWQSIKIVQELVSVIGHPPKKIFLEVTRENEDGKTKQQNAKLRLRRKDQLKACLKNSKELSRELNDTPDEKMQIKKIFLYFTQHGLCAYSGERLSLDDLSECDIDHIYPRSLTKDDSLTNNLVLVKSALNRDKTNTYPINADWRNRMRGIWASWLHSGSITKEKFSRLTRSTPLTTDELGNFIARQIVETSQSVKAIAELFQHSYTDTAIVTVKAGHVSDFRHYFGYDQKSKQDGSIIRPGRPEFIKIRELNDSHHAKDAYLNIVVGNVFHETYTSNPIKWLKSRQDTNYTLTTGKIFRDSEYYPRKIDKQLTNNPQVKGWHFSESIETVSRVMRKNGVLWTRMPITQSGTLFDRQPVSKSKDRFPLKKTKRLANTEKYGGYNSVSGAYFSLIDFEDKKGNTIRQIVPVPILYRDNPAIYLGKNYKNARIIISKILTKSLFKVNGMPLHLTGRTGKQLVFIHAKQLYLDTALYSNLKKILKISDNIKFYKKYQKTYEIPKTYLVDKACTATIYRALLSKLNEYKNTPTLNSRIDDIVAAFEDFQTLELNDQCEFIAEVLNIFACNAKHSDLSKLLSRSENLAGNTILINSKLSEGQDIKLIQQSITGLITKEIDLSKF